MLLVLTLVVICPTSEGRQDTVTGSRGLGATQLPPCWMSGRGVENYGVTAKLPGSGEFRRQRGTCFWPASGRRRGPLGDGGFLVPRVLSRTAEQLIGGRAGRQPQPQPLASSPDTPQQARPRRRPSASCSLWSLCGATLTQSARLPRYYGAISRLQTSVLKGRGLCV